MGVQSSESVLTTNGMENGARLVCAADSQALTQCFQLRYRYFVRKRRWVTPESYRDGIEKDRYDDHALHLAVFEKGEVAAYLRMLPSESPTGFMLDHEFADLIGEGDRRTLSRVYAAELSRLVCRSNPLKEAEEKTQSLELLFKLFYQVAQESGFSRFYIVVEEAWLRLFARRFGLSFRVVGHVHTFPDGTRTVAGVATLQELEDAMQRHCPVKRAWYGDKA